MESEILCIYLLWKVRFYVFYLFIMESEIHYGNTKLVQCFKINIILWRKKYVNIAIYIIISINEEKFGKIHLPFMKKILSKLGIERSLKKNIYKKTVWLISFLMVRNLKFSHKIMSKARMFHLTTPLQQCITSSN